MYHILPLETMAWTALDHHLETHRHVFPTRVACGLSTRIHATVAKIHIHSITLGGTHASGVTVP